MDLKRTEMILTKYYKEEIRLEQSPILLDHEIFDEYYYELADKLINNYYKTKQQIRNLLNTLTLRDTDVDVRFHNIKNKQLIHNIHSKQQGQLVEITGKIIKTTKTFPQITLAAYECSECGGVSNEIIKPDAKIKEVKKYSCNKCGRTGNHIFNKLLSEFDDVQIITVQETREDAKDGYKPAEIKCILRNEDTDTVKAGDMVTLNGVVELRNTMQKNLFDEYILVEYIETENEDYGQIELTPEEVQEVITASKEEDIYTKFMESIAPTIYGCDEIKEAVVLQLFGSDTVSVQNMHLRGDIHVLLVGDAGLGKSQILKFVSDLSPRGIYTSGKSSSGAGLTAVAMQDANGGWTLEAGAMVLADKGLLAIDELDKMSETDRSSIHEALEQQTISVSKAGMNTTLDTRCSVLAAANPKFGNFDQWDSKLSLADQINLSEPILSRFDLTFIMIDNGDDDDLMLDSLFEAVDVEPPFTMDFMRKYISYAKQEIHPALTPETRKELRAFYKKWRKHHKETGSGPAATMRQSGGLMRLAKASARVRLSDKVCMEDVQRATRLSQYCIDQYETQMSGESVEQIGYREKLDNKKTHNKLVHEIKLLARDYENKIPSSTIFRRMKEFGMSKNFVEAWLTDMDKNDKMVGDVTTGYWSCNGEWYKEK